MNSVLTSIPIYPMQKFWLPSNICDSIDAIVRNFIWRENPTGNHGWNLVKWDFVARPKRLGGLGVRRAKLSNIALLGKPIWDILSKPHKLWVQLLTSKCLGTSSVFECSPHAVDSYMWKSIMKVVVTLEDGFWYRVRCSQISFWYDRWLDDGALCKMVPYVNIQDVTLTVSNVLDAGHWSFSKLATTIPSKVCAK